MFGGLGNLVELLRNAKDIQSRFGEIQKEIASKRYDAETGGGVVRVVVDGKGSIVDIKIDPAAAADVELLEDLLKSAITSAVGRAHEDLKGHVAKLTGGLNIPGLDSMLAG